LEPTPLVNGIPEEIKGGQVFKVTLEGQIVKFSGTRFIGHLSLTPL
jgi:hypothetical protein